MEKTEGKKLVARVTLTHDLTTNDLDLELDFTPGLPGEACTDKDSLLWREHATVANLAMAMAANIKETLLNDVDE